MIEPSGELEYPTLGGLAAERITQNVARRYDVDPAAVEMELRPLRGGLEASAVARVVVRVKARDKQRTDTFVVKRLDGPTRREAELYREFLQGTGELAPRLLDIEDVGANSTYLYLEFIRRSRAWPWRELGSMSAVLSTLADLHTRVPSDAAFAALAGWDYEAELGRSALWTAGIYHQAVIAAADVFDIRRYGPALDRLVFNLPRLRAELLNATPAGAVVLHGDVHSGNVLLRARDERPVLIDWGRARLGSALEDVSSWLHSLGTWEPEARRKHDTLLRRYLAARGLPSLLLPSFREGYWLALACNSLAGALGYQLAVVMDKRSRSSRERLTAVQAARHHLRVIRHADMIWRR